MAIAADTSSDVRPFDALLLVSFGGPEKPADVLPFLDNVTRGRGIPRDRLDQVAEHYLRRGGRSPINDQCHALIAAIRADLDAHDIDVPLYWGNRNWDPYLRDTLARMGADGIRRAACFVTSAYASYSGCRQYRENLYDAVGSVDGAPRLDRLRHYFNHPGFVDPMVDATVDALATLPAQDRDDAHLVFVTHSIPTSMNRASGRGADSFPNGGAYVAQHLDVAATISTGVAQRTGRTRERALVFCSRSGPASIPWLEPDVNDHLDIVVAHGVRAVVVVPIGFVSDHMEVAHDLDTEAARTAGDLGIGFARAATPGVDARFVAMVRGLLVERAAVERGDPVSRPSVGALPPSWDRCPAGCCTNARDPQRPALGGSDQSAAHQ
ncbi:MAG: ferrochelatase [Nocardioidaceae bacterium]